VSIHWRSGVVNTLWGAASVRAWRRLRAALCNPADAQRRILLRYIRRSADTHFGRSHGFRDLKSISDYQNRVPVRTYEELEPLIRRVSQGEPRVLTRSPVERLVPSSGSTAAVKLVPFTAELRQEFSRAIDPWLVDLFMEMPALVGGPAYWSITPAAAFDTRSNARPAIPIGFDDDSMYLGGARPLLARAIMAVPPEVARLEDHEAFRYATALFLLRVEGLRLISVWHPSFLERVLDTITTQYDRLLVDVRRGSFTAPQRLTPEAGARLLPLLRPNPNRADALSRVAPDDVSAIWPELSLISCWADGPARGAAMELGRRCAGIRVQPKGLLATEGVVTIPLDEQHPVAIASHFFEFEEAGGGIRLAHELDQGSEYAIVLTTAGGLFRYRLGDRVKVDGRVGATPSLRFVGKDDRVSDWCGEKLSEGFVATVFESLFQHVPPPRFAMLVPERTATALAYTLLLKADGLDDERLATELERGLRRNPHYAWCVDLQQLAPARVVRVGWGASQAYIDACVARGQRLGDVKPACLRSETGWTSVLQSPATCDPRISGCSPRP
jgi:hypothetical protein